MFYCILLLQVFVTFFSGIFKNISLEFYLLKTKKKFLIGHCWQKIHKLKKSHLSDEIYVTILLFLPVMAHSHWLKQCFENEKKKIFYPCLLL